jgi:2-iminoacetate synthase ThiH
MSDDKFKTVTMATEVFEKLDKLRERQRKAMGVQELSWNNFLSVATPAIQEAVEAAEKEKRHE